MESPNLRTSSLFLANDKDSNVGRQLCISSLLVLITSFVTLHQVLPLGFSFADMLLFFSGLFILSCLFKLSPFDEKDFQLLKRNGRLVLSDQADNQDFLRFSRVTQYRLVQFNDWLGFGKRVLFYFLAFLACMFFWFLY
jgi:hypothetical protein